jgi:hypothetical protein
MFCDFHSLSFLASSLFAALARLFHKPWKSLTKVKQCSRLAFPPLHHQEHVKASVARGMGGVAINDLRAVMWFVM